MNSETEDHELRHANCELNWTTISLKHELERHRSQVARLEEKITEIKNSMHSPEEDSKKEFELLNRKIKAASTMLTYLKCKARIMADPHLAYKSCGIIFQEGIGLVDRHGRRLSDWSKDIDTSLGKSDEDTQSTSNLLDANHEAYRDYILKSVRTVTDVMESLFKQVIMAEVETINEKERVMLCLEDNKRKSLQIDSMAAAVEVMEKFALGTDKKMNEMRKKVEDMVEETSRQRQKAAENEEELHCVKQNLASLRSFADSLIDVREGLASSEKQFRRLEKLYDELAADCTRLENNKVQKEAQIQQLIKENVNLRSLLDKKEAQFLAMNEQLKHMTLNKPAI